jgi:ubiquinone/menaquinone biosynthesis C-methylase UbiE
MWAHKEIPMAHVFSETARYYDIIYRKKDYKGEAGKLQQLITERNPSARSLLDVACGTGRHIEYLKTRFRVQGMDICPEVLSIAREQYPDITFHQTDMTDFNLRERFDVITCLFSSIGYVRTMPKLRAAVRCMASHLETGGLLFIEPWFTPDQWKPHTVHALFVDEPELKIARVNTSFVDGRISIFDLHHLIGTPEGTEHIVEHHEMGLFETGEMRSVLKAENLAVEYDSEGLIGRGLFVATKAAVNGE